MNGTGVRVPAIIHHICALALMKSGRSDEQTINRIEQLWRMEVKAAKKQKRANEAAKYKNRMTSHLNRRYEDLCPNEKAASWAASLQDGDFSSSRRAAIGEAHEEVDPRRESQPAPGVLNPSGPRIAPHKPPRNVKEQTCVYTASRVNGDARGILGHDRGRVTGAALPGVVSGRDVVVPGIHLEGVLEPLHSHDRVTAEFSPGPSSKRLHVEETGIEVMKGVSPGALVESVGIHVPAMGGTGRQGEGEDG